jgi:hypothetical protein
MACMASGWEEELSYALAGRCPAPFMQCGAAWDEPFFISDGTTPLDHEDSCLIWCRTHLYRSSEAFLEILSLRCVASPRYDVNVSCF